MTTQTDQYLHSKMEITENRQSKTEFFTESRENQNAPDLFRFIGSWVHPPQTMPKIYHDICTAQKEAGMNKSSMILIHHFMNTIN
jgi:hypothetical protein